MMQTEQANHITRKKMQIACDNCAMARLCLPLGLSNEDIEKLDSLVTEREVINKGEYLFQSGSPFVNLYAIRSGSFKSFLLRPHGKQQIINFYLPGELLGFHAIAANKYIDSVIALETSSVCKIPFNDLFSLATQIPSLQSHFINLMSQQFNFDYVINSNQTAMQRLANFLLSISARFKRRGLCATEFNLEMTRDDMGNYLGLATETVSRTFSKLQQRGLIVMNRRQIKIVAFEKLQQLIEY